MITIVVDHTEYYDDKKLPTPLADNELSLLAMNNETAPLEVIGLPPKAKSRAKAKPNIIPEPVVEPVAEHDV